LGSSLGLQPVKGDGSELYMVLQIIYRNRRALKLRKLFSIFPSLDSIL
jgi:hypothetical protein